MTAPRPKPARITGIKHFFAAATYSIGGVKRLWQETAFRHIVTVCAICIIGLAVIGATLPQIGGFVVLVLLLVAAEALNTAIECLVDHLAPDWQEFARDAKDLGSLATMCLLVANGLYLVWVLAVNFGYL